MLLFLTVILILIISDMIEFRGKSKRDYIIYFSLIALTITGAGIYYR